MKRIYKIIALLIVAGTIIFMSIVFFLKKKEQSDIKNDIISESISNNELKISDFKQNGKFQFCGIPWGASLEEVKKMTPYSLIEDPSRPSTDDGIAFYISEGKHVLKEKSTTAVYELKNDRLIGVQLVFMSVENAVEIFEPIIVEASDLFGVESEKYENVNTGDISFLWESEGSALEIDSLNVNGKKVIMIFVSYTEK